MEKPKDRTKPKTTMASAVTYKSVLMEPLVGRRVKLVGLVSRKDLNNRIGVCKEYNTHKQRFVVELSGDGNNKKLCILVPLTSVEAADENEETIHRPQLLSTIVVRDGGSVYLGRTAMQLDLLSIFMERCRIEVQLKESNIERPRFRMAGCAACGKRPTTMVTCAGCGLCQWCDNDVCQRHGVEAGHGGVCQQFRAFRSIFDNSKIQEASIIFHSAAQIEGYSLALQEAARLANNAGLDEMRTEALGVICQCAVQWPASAEMATCPPGTKVRLSETQMMQLQMSFDVASQKFVPGKLTLCASSHKEVSKALSKKQLKEKHTLPCGQHPHVGMTKGIKEDMSHPPIKARLKDLSTRRMQQILCTAGCNKHQESVVMKSAAQKAILSDVFYSFCLQRVCNANALPGSIQHCPMCGLCRNYMYSHCSRCNSCSYGSLCRAMPCMHCHDMMLLHDGVAFVPVAHGQCQTVQASGIMAALTECKCGNGELIFNDSNPSTRQQLKPSVSHSQQLPAVGPSDEDMSALLRAATENQWADAQTNHLERVALIDKVLLYMKSDLAKLEGNLRTHLNTKMRGMYYENFEAFPSSSTQSLGAADILKGHDELFKESCKATETFMRKFEAQRQKDAAPGGATPTSTADDESDSLENWLVLERGKAAAMAMSEKKTLRASGVRVDKERYKDVLAKRCDFCDAKETPSKALKTCTGCKAALYCDAECQARGWPNHIVKHASKRDAPCLARKAVLLKVRRRLHQFITSLFTGATEKREKQVKQKSEARDDFCQYILLKGGALTDCS
jgi:hypothetical protein